jgi:asparagine synthase (glutamine-hydrolysing)
MCGFAGCCDRNRNTSRNTLVAMTDVLGHRGPDESGCSYSEAEQFTIGLGYRRLSILDLSSNGHQPMTFENIEIVYNGEVYNFVEIRKELEAIGYAFNSDSDTEVILTIISSLGYAGGRQIYRHVCNSATRQV